MLYNGGMNEETETGVRREETCGSRKCRHHRGGHAAHAGGGAMYGLGLIGAAVYYIQQADTFSAGAIGLLKALVWPAFFVYKLFGFLGM